MRYYEAIQAAYPDLTLITSNDRPECLPQNLPEDVWIDRHIYTDPDSLVKEYTYFDGKSRINPYVVFEYAVSETDPPSNSNALWPYMKGSCAEAVYMLGLEHNQDLVKMASYAPLLAHLDYSTYTVSFSTLVK